MQKSLLSKGAMITSPMASPVTAFVETYPRELHLLPVNEQHCITQRSQQ